MEPFKTCPNCGRQWLSREEFLADPKLIVVGYQVSFVDLEAGLFLFNHTVANCGTTMSVEAGEFMDLVPKPMFEDAPALKTGMDGCPAYCLYSSNLEPCPAKCECAYVRDVLQIVRNWPKI